MTLENDKVSGGIERYISTLSRIIEARTDAVGYAYTVNGRFSGADLYASPDLFRRMWPKLLHSSAAEALAERGKSKAPERLGTGEIHKALTDADAGSAGPPRKNGVLSVTKTESSKSVLFVTAKSDSTSEWVHKSYIAK
jgi:hypothetical protein